MPVTRAQKAMHQTMALHWMTDQKSAFGTPCAALEDPETRRKNHRYIPGAVGNLATDAMDMKPATPQQDEDD